MLRHRHLSIAALCTLPLALIACGKTSAPDPRTAIPLVRTVEVAPGASAERAFTGIIAARVQSDLGFRVSGKVLERLVDAGQSVKRGQPLLRIDSVDLKLAAQAQDDAVAAAKASAQQASEEEARYRDLRGTGAISASAYDQVKAAADSATAQLRAAQAQAQVARNASGYAQLLADADGVVVETLVEPGQVVTAGQVVVRLAQAGRREAVVQLPETLRPALGSPAMASLYGRQDGAVPARLRQLADVADRATRTFEARYVLEGGIANAPLGSTVTVNIAGKPQSAALQVPLSALLDDGNGPAVWLLEGTQVKRQQVAIARIEGDQAHVTGALRQGDRIVALGAHLLKDGAAVRVAAQAPAAPSTGGRSE